MSTVSPYYDYMYTSISFPIQFLHQLTNIISAANLQTTFWDTINLQTLKEGQLTNRIFIISLQIFSPPTYVFKHLQTHYSTAILQTFLTPTCKHF